MDLLVNYNVNLLAWIGWGLFALLLVPGAIKAVSVYLHSPEFQNRSASQIGRTLESTRPIYNVPVY